MAKILRAKKISLSPPYHFFAATLRVPPLEISLLSDGGLASPAPRVGKPPSLTGFAPDQKANVHRGVRLRARNSTTSTRRWTANCIAHSAVAAPCRCIDRRPQVATRFYRQMGLTCLFAFGKSRASRVQSGRWKTSPELPRPSLSQRVAKAGTKRAKSLVK